MKIKKIKMKKIKKFSKVILGCIILYLIGLSLFNSIYYPSTNVEEKGARKILKRIETFRNNIAECQNYKNREMINPTFFYFYNKTKGLLWCKVPKAGSTTLVNLYLRLAGVDRVEPDKKAHEVLRHFYPKLKLDELQRLVNSNSVVTFMIVRHPFERLVSAYRDKLANYERDLKYRDGYYYQSFGKLMIPPNERNSSRVPTWSEFVSYLIKTSIWGYDEHWMPMSRLCSPCAVNYTYIIKLEHLQHQIQHLLKRVEINASNIGWSHPTGTNRTIVNKYFNNLTLSDIKKLYVKYERDFQLFGYKPNRYFK